MSKPNFYPVILAGGRGTRFWPRSRKKLAKQVLALAGERTMIQQTIERLSPLVPPQRFWVITNDDLRDVIVRQLHGLSRDQIIAEPAARNTAPAIGLAAFVLEREDPRAVIGMFPADHVIADEKKFRKTVERAIDLAAAGDNIVVMGVKPTRPETGYGYIEAGGKEKGVLRVKRFTEKPALDKAEDFLAAGNYYWNSGMFLWSARTLANALREHLSESAPYLDRIADAWGTKDFAATFKRLYPKCESISVDYAVLEPRSAKGEHSSHLYCIPAEFGWNDLGSWAALYEHHARNGKGDNVIEAKSGVAMEATGNYIYAPNKFVAAVGVNDIVVVDTEDALLVTTRDRSQDVGKLVKELEQKKLEKLL
ncbi:MAG TPA: mannose-1-phosphate guanylyltransferase [Terriglobales bacterium]|nr:mannose-1-phosphate guanylyltransferase [Terriglobales bacterium]